MKKKSETDKMFLLTKVFLGWIFLLSLLGSIFLIYKTTLEHINLTWLIVFIIMCLLICVYSAFLIFAIGKAEKEQKAILERIINIEQVKNKETSKD